MSSKKDDQDLPCAVIITAIQVEFKAVIAHLGDTQEIEHPDGTVYEVGVFSSNNRRWKVAVGEIGAGNAEAAVETKRAIDYFKPTIVLFVGVAGGIKDVALGDVVAATKAYGYESGKLIEATFYPRPNVSSVSYSLEQRAKAVARKDNWLERIIGEDPVADKKPSALVGPIAAGDKVVASTNSEVYKLLKSTYGDALAVEMESHGFLKAIRANPEINALIIRGISDLIEGKSKADASGSQLIAARHASAFAFEVLATVNSGVQQGTNNPLQTTDVIVATVEQYISDPNLHINLEKLVIQEAKAVADIMQGNIDVCPWSIPSHNQSTCQECIEYLEAKSERLVRILATIIKYDQNNKFIYLLVNALNLLVREPSPMSTYVTDEGRFIRLYPLTLAMYAVFIVGVQERKEQLLRAVVNIPWNREPNSSDLSTFPIISTLIYFQGYSGTIFNAVLGLYYRHPAPAAERIKTVLIPWIQEMLFNPQAAFYQGEFILGLADIESEGATIYSVSEKRLFLQGLYLYDSEAHSILTTFLQNSSQWLVKLYPSLEKLLETFDATASRLDPDGWGRLYGFYKGSLAAFKRKINY